MDRQRAAVISVVLAGLLFAVGVSATSQADVQESLYGTVNVAAWPVETEYFAPVLLDDAIEGDEGAVVAEEDCLIRSGAIFRTTIMTTGQLVITPSGTAHLVCHVQLTRRDLRVPVTEAIVVDNLPCQIGDGGTRDSHLVVTPALGVHFICHRN